MFVKSKDGLKIHYFIKRNKKKKFIVFLHGLAGDYTEFKHQIDFFKKNYSILAVDFRGHGLSSKPKEKKYYLLGNYISDVLTILKKEKIINPIFIGFSLGTYVAMELCKKIKYSKLIMINPVFGWKSIRKFFIIEEFISRFIPKFVLKLFIKSDKLYEFHNLLDLYSKMLVKTPVWVHKNIVENGILLPNIEFSDKCFIIKSKFDEIVTNWIPIKNYSIAKVDAFHYVHCQKYEQVNSIIQSLL